MRTAAAGPVQAFDAAGSEALIEERAQTCGQVQCASPLESSES